MKENEIKTITKCDQIRLRLEERIRGLDAGDALPSGPHLAEEYGVSRFTVSRAIAALVAEGKLRRAQGKGTFVCDPAKPLASGRVGLIFGKNTGPGEPGSFYHDIFDGIQDVLLSSSFRMVLGHAGNAADDPGAIRELLEKDRIEGALILGRIHDDALALLKHHSLRPITVDYAPADPDISAVLTDNLGGARSAVTFLLEQGHTRIAFASSEFHTSFAERYQGYVQVLQEAGIVIEERLVLREFPDENPLPAFLTQANRPTAVFCGNDIAARGVILTAREIGLQVPNDLSVMGFDDDRVAATIDPPLSTIRVHRRRMGRAAAKLLLEAIEQTEFTPRRDIVPTERVVRESVTVPYTQA